MKHPGTPEPEPAPLTVWRHVKRDTLYTVLSVSLGVVYYVSHARHELWWRPVSEFMDGRFEQLPKAVPLSLGDMGFNRG